LNRSGFGLSSAEFNCVYDIYLKKKNLKKNLFHLYQEYLSLSSGSGADVISQQVKGCCLLSLNPFSTLCFKWPFKNLSFFLVRIQENHSTHQHLKELNEKDFSKLIEISNQAFLFFKQSNEEKFIECIQEYEKELDQLNLVHPLTKKWIQKLKKNPSVQAVKGCGALGAEIMLLFFLKEKESQVIEHLKDLKIEAGIHSIEEKN